MMTIIDLKARLAIGVAAAALVSGAAVAQEAAQAGGLEEIVVTAQRRSENLQNVPVSVSALNAVQVERRFGRDISDLGSIAPNLIIDPLYGVASASISIRGLQLNDGEKSFDPAVAVYLDGVYLASTTGALLNVFDAEAVEVLRGPQGTLFGRNTIGGLIHVRRSEPTGELGGKALLTYGSFDQFDAKAVVNLPSFANDLISTKVAVSRFRGGGYFDNITRGKSEGNNNLTMYSASVKIAPSADAKLVINYDFIDDKSNTRPVTALTANGEAFCNGVFGPVPGCGQPQSNADYHRKPVTAIRQEQWSKTHSVIANGEYNFSPDHGLFTVIGYRSSEESSLQKFDGVKADLFYVIRPQTLDQFSAELRYQGSFGPVKAVVGGYYYNSSYDNLQQVFFFGGEADGFTFDQTSKNIAGFGQLDWEVVDNLTLTAGGRYTHETKRVCDRTAKGPVDARVETAAFGACSAEIQASPIYVPDAVNPATGEVFRQTGEASWSRFTPRLALNYKFENGIIFASYSEGFRSGGFNGRATSAFLLGPYNPETVKNYEVGVKTEWLDNRLRFNLAAFNMQYRDKQEDVVFPDPAAVTVTLVQNAARARIRGFEAELTAVPVDGLTLGANLGFLDAKYNDWTDRGINLDPATAGTTPFVTIDKSDFKLRRAPRWNFDLNATYEYSLGNDGKLVLQADYRWKDDYYIIANTFSFANPNPGLVKAFGLLDASVGYQTDRYKVSVFGKNITGTNYFQHVLDVGTSFGATPTNPTPQPIPGLWTYGTIAPPATFGIEVQFKF